MTLQMHLCGDLVLREKSAAVVAVTPEIRAYLDAMVRMMQEQVGVGLAAPQVGISQRFLVMKDMKGKDDFDSAAVLQMINPRIIAKSMEYATAEEGCLSVQGPSGPVFAEVSRPESVIVEWADESGAPQRRKFTGFSSRIVQHEIDHLDGILFIDYLSSAKREMVMRKVKKRKE
ncbi:MAG: peptide deformylase [Alphaproteobacteria bacterium]|nr:peptide deformylase [Alphaproteobacteria bacterium]